ncbi:hypothetical protein D9758_004136 [Tetrapyrgos nigripes]|uniref:Mitochondrial genome maintenance protein MGM101 n=1 Tax=Tetrapyrgos nigripes TaxID=182062 RepID=A0A8H5GU78_9AGAR|nr:hypothetical protein D9758_004136 [Tetrapyrgos nigripes]
MLRLLASAGTRRAVNSLAGPARLPAASVLRAHPTTYSTEAPLSTPKTAPTATTPNGFKVTSEVPPPSDIGNGTGEAGTDWSKSYQGLSQEAFPKEIADILMAPIDPMDIEMKPDGLIYLPEIKYRRILNRAFGPGGWGLAPRSETNVGPKVVSREYALVCLGRLVAIARGEQEYFDPTGIPTATESVKSNALMRCCKDLGIASELWDPRFIRQFKSKYCVEVFAEHIPTKKKTKMPLPLEPALEFQVDTSTTEIFFPPDNTSIPRGQHRSKSFQDSRNPSALMHRLINARNDGTHLSISRVEYMQRRIKPFHEFVVVVFRRGGSGGFGHRDSSEGPQRRENFAVLERNLSDTFVERSTPFSWKKRFAEDIMHVSCTGDYRDLEELMPGGWIKLAELQVDGAEHTDRFTMGQLAVLTAVLQSRVPYYRLCDSQCYYYARMIWQVVNMAVGSNVQVAGGQRRQNVFGRMMDRMKAEVIRGAPEVKSAFEERWDDFVEEVARHREEHQRYYRNAIADAARARTMRDEAVIQRDEAIALMKSLEDEKARLAEQLNQSQSVWGQG